MTLFFIHFVGKIQERNTWEISNNETWANI